MNTKHVLLCLALFFAGGLPVGVAHSSEANSLPAVAAGNLVRLPDFPSAHVPARPVDVWLPDSYDGTRPHAVLYMLDGQMLFDGAQTWNGQEWRVDETATELIQAGAVRPFIVVAIHNIGAGRQSEYFPEQPFLSLSQDARAGFYRQRRGSGEVFLAAPVYSDALLRFVVTELKPYIDKHYRVLGDRANTFMAGSSMGGLLSWYALAQYPAVFGGVAAMSTHWLGGAVDDGVAFPAFLKAVNTLPANSAKLYFDYGDATLDQYYPKYQQQVDKLLRERGWRREHWRTHFAKGADHTENAWAARLSQPLTFLLAN